MIGRGREVEEYIYLDVRKVFGCEFIDLDTKWWTFRLDEV